MKIAIALISYAALGLASLQLPLHSTQQTREDGGSCPNPPELSCQKATNVAVDTCCSESPGGQFALTQFWNSDGSRGRKGYLGPKESWTLHGLWPDHCDGSYDSSCDSRRNGDCSSYNRGRCNRAYQNIGGIMLHFGEQELLSNMTTFWKGIAGDEHLHQHEWSKHGTCVSTLSPKCYRDEYYETQEVVHYFSRAMKLFHTLPTYVWLADAGITPSREKTYALEDIMAALKAPRGVSPIVSCQGRELREVWYHYYVRGSVRDGGFEATEPVIPRQHLRGCPRDGILYLPKDDY